MDTNISNDSLLTISLESDDEVECGTISNTTDGNKPSSSNESESEKSQPLENASKEGKSEELSEIAHMELVSLESKDTEIICLDDEDKYPDEIPESKNSKAVSLDENFSSDNVKAFSNSNNLQEDSMETNTLPTATLQNIDMDKDESLAENMEEDCPKLHPQNSLEEQEQCAVVHIEDNDSMDEESDKCKIESHPIKTGEEIDEKNCPTLSENARRRRTQCCYLECKKTSKEFCEAPQFALNLYEIPSTRQTQNLCMECFEFAVQQYELCSSLLENHQPLLLTDLPVVNESVELILDSSDEEDEKVALKSAPPLNSDVIALVESELNNVTKSMLEQINIDQQMQWTFSILGQKAQHNLKMSEEINEQINSLTRTLDGMCKEIYSIKPTNVQIPELIIMDENRKENINNQVLELMKGVKSLERPKIKINEIYYGAKQAILASWIECTVIEEIFRHTSYSSYNVRYLNNVNPGLHILSARHLAYKEMPNVKLKLGTRVIAKINPKNSVDNIDGDKASHAFYVGTVIESLSNYNNHRYLILFDSGHTFYVPFTEVRVVCNQSKHVWEDVHPHSKRFIKSYMQTSGTLRPMVQVKRGQRLTVEIDEKWYHSTVVGVDCSMVQLYFPVLNRYEWIYRGSTRLGPLYLGVNTSAVPTNKFSKFQKRNVPSIEYITIEDDENEDSNVYAAYVKPDTTHFANLKQDPQGTQHRATARKSTANRTNHNTVGAISLNRSTIYIDCDVDRSFGTTVKFTTKNYRGPLKFVKHECSTECLYNNTKVLRSYNLLSRPLIVGWERHLCSAQNQKKEVVVYRAPCGRRLRSMYEVHRFLRQTNCSLSVEHFDFDPVIRVLATYKSENCIFETPDISFGKEIMPIQCVNNYDDKTPPPCDYSAERIPTEGVNLNLDKEFLCGCDCEDDCFDKRKCQCFQLTMKGVKSQNPKANIDEVGYVYKRLMEPVITGIYECNVQCKCNKNKCLNRVVQHPLQTKLQVFNTKNKGWGIRCLNDVPKGSFICIYAGQLLTEEASNRICINDKTGDEYFADLDFIETMENLKEGYETEAYRSEEEYDEPSNTYESDVSEESTENMTITSTQDSDEEYTSKIKPTNMAVKTRSQLKKNSTTQHYTPSVEDENDERECVGLIPNSQMDNNDALGPEDGKIVKLRSLFGKNEQMCVLDAKKSGNLGRYFNHSCGPNLFVQNVFVDTHDLRFPWVAFFSDRNIEAGTELTWHYNYDVGSVKGKVLVCHCGDKRCKGRLL